VIGSIDGGRNSNWYIFYYVFGVLNGNTRYIFKEVITHQRETGVGRRGRLKKIIIKDNKRESKCKDEHRNLLMRTKFG
jgi:hypothetical protein